jgi:hypothetical protein
MAIHTAQADGKWIQWIRIQSPALLMILARLCESWSLRPRTFWSPFELFVHLQDKIEDVLNELEVKWGNTENLTPVFKGPGSQETTSATKEPQNLSLDDSVEVLRNVRCLVRFVDEKVIPLNRQFGKSDATLGLRKVRFNDLWFLFRTGEFVYTLIN